MDASQITAEAREIVRAAMQPVKLGESRSQQLWRAAQRLCISYGKAKAYYYGERKRIAADEYLNLRARLDTLDERAEYRKAVLDDLAQAHARARRVLQMESGENGPSIAPLGAVGQEA